MPAEQEQATPVLTYDPPQRNRPRWEWFGAGFVAGAVVSFVACLFIGATFRMRVVPGAVPRAVPATPGVTSRGLTLGAGTGFAFPQAQGKLQISDNSIGVPYGKFVFLSAGRDVVALRMTCPGGDGAAISYDWLHSTQGAADFASADVARGSGTSVEAGGSGRLTAGPFSLLWSQGSPAGGWVYWPTRHPDLVVASETADEPGEFADVLSKTTWQARDGTTLDWRRDPVEGP
jgi:hypothetical protein